MLLPSSVLWYVLNSILVVFPNNQISFLKDLVFGYVLLWFGRSAVDDAIFISSEVDR